MLDCRAGDLSEYRLTWKAPRTEGVEFRVYGVTKCIRTEASEGACLREHTKLPADIRVLLAKGPASTGEVSLDGLGPYYATDDGCAYGYSTEGGTPIFSIVVAAYSTSGHSIFAIAAEGRYEPRECGVDVY